MKTNLLITGLMAVALAGCNATKMQTKTQTKAETQTPTPAPTQTADEFCYGLLAQSIAEGENAFLSPASAAMALQMLVPGAEGTTLSELQTVVPTVQIDTTPQLKIASAMWINEGLKVKPAFLKANAQAEVYRGPITADKVNQWASDHTNGKVNKVLSEPVPPIEMALTNALYFKDQWIEPFHEINTQPAPFYGKKGEQQVQMMHQTNHFLYLETKHLQAIQLHYHGPYCMEIYLPKKGVSLEDGIKDAYSLEVRGERKKVALALPKFKLEYEKQLNDYLKRMGLQACFSRSQADFSRLSDTPLYVDFVKQNTYLAIDEVGTEAAAVTTIGLAKMAYRPEPEEIIPMTVDRPFILFIRDRTTDQILFYGVIYDIHE